MHSTRLPARGLYALTPDEPDDAKLINVAEACLAGGAALLQYRDKRRTFAARSALATKLRLLCITYCCPLIINDDVALALACGADGVHLGKEELESLPLAGVHKSQLLIGVSCYDSMIRARAAISAGADYVAFGSIFSSSTKPSATRCSFDLLRAAKQELTVPIVAIGGLTPENGRQVIEAGADFLAVINGIFGQSDVQSATAQYVSLFS